MLSSHEQTIEMIRLCMIHQPLWVYYSWGTPMKLALEDQEWPETTTSDMIPYEVE